VVAGLSARGDHAVAVGRDEERLMALHTEHGASPLLADLTSKEGWDAVVGFVADKGFRVRGVIHSAGVVHPASLENEASDDVSRQMLLNLQAPMELTRRLVPHFVQGAHVVMLSSTLAHRPAPGRAAYAATKAGIEGYVRAAALELGPRGVSVNGIAPGVVDTDMIRDAVGHDEKALDGLRGLHRLGRLGTPEDIWLAVEYLLDSEFVTGTVITVDGGLCLG